jgi:hypothetical protein
MPRTANAGLLVALLLTWQAAPAYGFGRGRVYTASYYYPAFYPAYYPSYYAGYSYSVPVTVSYVAPAWPVYYAMPAPVYCPPVVSVPASVTVPTGPLYAVPTPAPPSQSFTPPSGKPAPPQVTEMRSGTDGQPPGPAVVPVKDRVQVGFWNVSGRDLTLTIDGQRRLLPRNRSITLQLGRQFVWQVDQRAAQKEDIPEGNSTLEIVLRR